MELTFKRIVDQQSPDDTPGLVSQELETDLAVYQLIEHVLPYSFALEIAQQESNIENREYACCVMRNARLVPDRRRYPSHCPRLHEWCLFQPIIAGLFFARKLSLSAAFWPMIGLPLA
jgi:hypothetical protein